MLPIYEQDIDEELKVSKGSPALLPTSHVINKRIAGVKLGLSVSYGMIAAALIGLAYMYYMVQGEIRERQVLQASHIALSERTAAMKAALEDVKTDAMATRTDLKNELARQSAMQIELRKEIEKRRIEILNMQKRIKGYENQDIAPAPAPALPPRVENVSQTSFPFQSGVTVANVPSQEFTPLVPAAPTVSQTTVVPQSALVNVQTTEMTTPTLSSKPADSSVPVSSGSAADDRVLTINRQFQFVVVNVGSEDKVKEGQIFDVIREGRTIASVQVEKLYDNFSAATIIKESKDLLIEVGDGIRRSS